MNTLEMSAAELMALANALPTQMERFAFLAGFSLGIEESDKRLVAVKKEFEARSEPFKVRKTSTKKRSVN